MLSWVTTGNKLVGRDTVGSHGDSGDAEEDGRT